MLQSLSAGMEMADMTWEIKCRDEDMKQRALENERRAIDDARRSVDEKAQQLKALANQAALIAGFSTVVMVEISIPENLDPWLLTIFGCTSASVVAAMLVAMLNCTLMLVAILRYDCIGREIAFSEFWRKRCESDFNFAIQAFGLGVPLFIGVLAQVGWVVFWNHPRCNVAASLVSTIAIGVLILWFARTQRKWMDFLLASDAKLYNPHA